MVVRCPETKHTAGKFRRPDGRRGPCESPSSSSGTTARDSAMNAAPRRARPRATRPARGKTGPTAADANESGAAAPWPRQTAASSLGLAGVSQDDLDLESGARPRRERSSSVVDADCESEFRRSLRSGQPGNQSAGRRGPVRTDAASGGPTDRARGGAERCHRHALAVVTRAHGSARAAGHQDAIAGAPGRCAKKKASNEHRNSEIGPPRHQHSRNSAGE